MATYRQRGDMTYVEICVNGKREGATFPKKRQAEDWAAYRSSELRLTNQQRALDYIVADVFAEYARRVSPTKRGARWEIIRFNLLSRYPVAKIKLRDLCESHIVDWRDQRLTEVSPSSVHRELCLMSHAFEKARKEWRWIPRNPCADVDRPKRPPHRERLFMPGEIDRMCAAFQWKFGKPAKLKIHRVAVAMLFAIETAMRASEICGMTADRIDLEKRVVFLPLTKNGRTRSVPLSSRAIELLGFLPGVPAGRPVFDITVEVLDSLFRRKRIDAGIDNLKFHDTRHEAITRLAKIYNPLELARVVGHTDLKMLLVYYNETAEQLAKKLT